MKCKLFDRSHRHDHEEILKKMASDLYDEMIKICERVADYGENETSIIVESLETFKWIKDDHVYLYLNAILIKEGLLRKIEFPIYHLTWHLLPEESKMPRITARDLIQLGFKPNEEMGMILKDLKTAKVNGEVANTIQSEILWIKKNFK